MRRILFGLGLLALGLIPAFSHAVTAVLVGCNTDDLSGVAASSGYWDGAFDANDIEPLCSGWVLVADKTNNRLLLVDAVRGVVSTAYPMTTSPYRLAYDASHGWVWATQKPATAVTKVDLSAVTATNIFATNYTTQIAAGDGYAFALTGDQWSTSLELFSGLTDALVNTREAYYYGSLDYNDANKKLLYTHSSTSSGDYTQYSFASPPALTVLSTQSCEGYLNEDQPQDPSATRFIGSTSMEIKVSDSAVTYGSFDAVNANWPTTSAYRPQGSLYAAGYSSEVAVFDSQRHCVVERFTPPISASPSDIQKVRYSRGGAALFTLQKRGTGGCRIHWRKQDPAALILPTPTPAAAPASWVGCASDGTPGASSGTLALPGTAVDMVAFCGGWVAVSLAWSNDIYLVNAVTGLVNRRIQLTASPGHLSYDPVNGWLYATLKNATFVARIDLASGTVTYLQTNFAAAGVAAGSCGNVFTANNAYIWWDSDIEAFDASGTKRASYPIGVECDLGYDAVNDRLVVMNTGNTGADAWLISRDPVTYAMSVSATVSGVGSFEARPVISPDGTRWTFAPHYPGPVQKPMNNLGAVLGQWTPLGSSGYGVAYSPGGDYASVVDGSHLELFRTSDHVKVASFTPPSSNDYRVTAFSLGRKFAFALETVSSWASSTGRLYWNFHGLTDAGTPPSAFTCGTLTYTPTRTPSLTQTPSFSASPTFSDSPTPSPTRTATATFTESPTFSASPTATPSPTGTRSVTESPTTSVTASATLTRTPSATRSATPTYSDSPTASPTRTPTGTPSDTPSITATSTASPTASVTATRSATRTATPSATPSLVVSATLTPVPTQTWTPLPALTLVVLPSQSPTPAHFAQDRLGDPYPAPWDGQGQLRLPVDKALAGNVQLQLFDLRGQLVQTIADGVFQGPSRRIYLWDGADRGGRAVASGLYLVLLKTDQARQVKRVVVAR